MKNKLIIFGVAVCVLFLAAAGTSNAEDSKYRLGLQGTHFVTGLSGVMEISNPWALGAVIDFGVDNFAFRVLNRFHNEKDWNSYFLGQLGMWDHDNGKGEDETDFGLGVGVGLEYDWRCLNPSLPPIGWNIELGASIVPDFDLDFGVGLHWKF